MIRVKDEWVLVQNWEVDEDKTQLGIQRLQKEKEISDHTWVSVWALKFRHRCQICAPLQLRSSHHQEKKGEAARMEKMVDASRQKVSPLQEDHRRCGRRRRGWVK